MCRPRAKGFCLCVVSVGAKPVWPDILLAGRPAIARMRAREFRDRPHMQQYFQMIERP